MEARKAALAGGPSWNCPLRQLDCARWDKQRRLSDSFTGLTKRALMPFSLVESKLRFQEQLHV